MGKPVLGAPQGACAVFGLWRVGGGQRGNAPGGCQGGEQSVGLQSSAESRYFCYRPLKALTMYQKILVPLDGSPTSDHGLRVALELANDQKEKARLVLLHVVDDFSMLVEMSAVANYQQMLDGLRRYGQELLTQAKNTAQALGIDADVVSREVTQQSIADVILEEARSVSCDLIVMGTHGRRGVRRMTMGSDAEQVVRSSLVPVLLVRHEDAKSASFLSKLQSEAGAYAKSGIPIQ